MYQLIHPNFCIGFLTAKKFLVQESYLKGLRMEPSRKSSVELAKEEIICPLCMDIFDNPRSLQCLHSYCEKCLYGLHKSTLFAGTIACPECRANTVLPTDGIKGDCCINPYKIKASECQ